MRDYDAYIWGKKAPFCSLAGHMLCVGACAEAFLSAPSLYELPGVIASVSWKE